MARDCCQPRAFVLVLQLSTAYPQYDRIMNRTAAGVLGCVSDRQRIGGLAHSPPHSSGWTGGRADPFVGTDGGAAVAGIAA